MDIRIRVHYSYILLLSFLFLLPETSKLLGKRGLAETIEAQMMVGGVPKYLELLNEQPTVHLGIENLAFSKSGYLFSEYKRIFTSHFGKRPEYEKIIAFLSRHPYGMLRKQISKEILSF